MDQSPYEPSKKAAHLYPPALQYGKVLTDHGKVPFVKITKRAKRGLISHFTKD